MSEISPLCEGSIGCISASVPVATFQPLDTLKIRLQTERHLYKNLHDCWTKIVKKEGIISAYKGMWAAVLSQAPINFFIFAGNSVGEKLIQNFDISDGKKAYFSGSVGGLFGTLATCPTELLKCRLQVNKTRLTMQSNLLRNEIMTIWRAEGIKGYFHGYAATFWRDVPFYGLWFFCYDRTCYYLANSVEEYEKHEVAMWKVAVGGGIGGWGLWLGGYAFDTCKSLIQTDPTKSQSMRRIWKEKIKVHGPRFLTQGLGTCLIRAFPVNALTFVLYDRMKWLCENNKV